MFSICTCKSCFKSCFHLLGDAVQLLKLSSAKAVRAVVVVGVVARVYTSCYCPPLPSALKETQKSSPDPPNDELCVVFLMPQCHRILTFCISFSKVSRDASLSRLTDRQRQLFLATRSSRTHVQLFRVQNPRVAA